MTRLIGITGGIGSGKSVVCRVVGSLGCPVYDCDLQARRLMEESKDIQRRIAEEISPEAVKAGGKIDRKTLSRIVFSDPAKLAALNGIVHGEVKADLRRWVAGHQGDDPLLVETAILYQCGLSAEVDEVWEVVAPTDLRIRRAQMRDNATREQILARIAAQCYHGPRHPRSFTIVNDGLRPLLPQVERLSGL